MHHQMDSEAEMYTLEDLPRITALNDAEVQSIDSALLSAEEQDLIDTSSSAVELEMGQRTPRYSKSPSSAAYLNDRKVSASRQMSAVSAARRMGHMQGAESRDRSLERRINVVTPSMDPYGGTPSTLRRNVSAFGEITVMPVGDNEDDDLRVSVEEELKH